MSYVIPDHVTVITLVRKGDYRPITMQRPRHYDKDKRWSVSRDEVNYRTYDAKLTINRFIKAGYEVQLAF